MSERPQLTCLPGSSVEPPVLRRFLELPPSLHPNVDPRNQAVVLLNTLDNLGRQILGRGRLSSRVASRLLFMPWLLHLLRI